MGSSRNNSLFGRWISDPRIPWALVVLLVLTATFILSTRQDTRVFPNDDIVVYSVIAKFWAQGDIPYRDLVDHKPPGIYLFYRLCFLLWGETPTAIWQGFIALTGITTALLIWAFASVNAGAAGLGLGFSFAAFFLTDPFRLGDGAFLNTELLASGCLAISLAFTVLSQNRLRLCCLLLAGSAFGYAIITKQPAAVFLPALIVHILLTSRRHSFLKFCSSALASLTVFGIGAALPPTLAITYFASHGALDELITWVHRANLSYTGILGATFANRLGVLREHQGLLLKHLGQPSAIPFMVGLYAAPILFLLRRSWLDVMIALWFVGALATSSLNTQYGHTHYLVFYQVATALLIAGLFHTVSWIGACLRRGPWFSAAVSLVALYLVFGPDITKLKNQVDQMLTRPPFTAPLPFQNDLIKVMDEATKGFNSNEKIFFLGMTPTPLFYSHLRPATQYIYQPPLGTISMDEFFGDMIEDITSKKPAVAFIQTYRDNTFKPEQPDKYGEFSRVFLDHFEPWLWAPHGRIFKRKGATPNNTP